MLDFGGCVWGCLDGYVGPSGGEAPGVPGFTVVVCVADAPFAADEVRVADGASGVSVLDPFGLHGGVCSVW